MLLFVIPILLLSSSVNSQIFLGQKRSAASESQIKFAIENNYDQTGPGAKTPEYAYDTFDTLEDSLIGYLDDPDTKLPQYERTIAEQKLLGAQKGYRIKERPIFLSSYPDKSLYYSPEDVALIALRPNEQKTHRLPGYFKSMELEKATDPYRYRYQKIQSVKGSPLNLAHYTKEPQQDPDFNPNPQYSFSYGVHDKLTGDSKSAQESRQDGVVRGFYTFRDADGKQRTVEYTADDALGFRAIVKRTNSNSQ